MRTAFIARPDEFGGPNNKHYTADLDKAEDDDIGAVSIIDLAEKLGA